MNLFDITAKIERLLNEAAENEGVIGESQEEELTLLEVDLGDKLYAYSFVCDKFDKDIAFLKERKQALDDRIKQTEKRKDCLKNIIARCVWMYGEDVLKKNPDTNMKEPTGSKSLKFPDISISVRKAPDVKTDTDMFNSFVQSLKYAFDGIEGTTDVIDKSKEFINVKLNKELDFDKARFAMCLLKDNGIAIDDGTFSIVVNSKKLKEILMTSPEGLDAWSLEEKDVVTIRK